MSDTFWTGYLIFLSVISVLVFLSAFGYLMWQLGWRKGYKIGHKYGLAYHETYLSEIHRLKVRKAREIDIPVPDKDDSEKEPLHEDNFVYSDHTIQE